jgi:hypothetical protein
VFLDNQCPVCNRKKATEWCQPPGDELCFRHLVYGLSYLREDKAFHEAAVDACKARAVDWRAILIDWIARDHVTFRVNDKWYHHPFGSYGFSTKEEAVRALVEVAVKGAGEDEWGI